MTAEKKATTQQKVKKITLRVSEEEDKLLKEFAEKEGLSINEFIRTKLLKFKPKRKNQKVCEELKEFLYEIRRIGINLNQLSRLGNWLLKEENLTTEEVLIHLEKIANSLEEIEKDLNLLVLEVINNVNKYR
jgi:hypothetical protein